MEYLKHLARTMLALMLFGMMLIATGIALMNYGHVPAQMIDAVSNGNPVISITLAGAALIGMFKILSNQQVIIRKALDGCMGVARAII